MPLALYRSLDVRSEGFGMEAEATWWLTSANGMEVGGSGISATLRDFGRFGLFVLGGGMAGGERILPEGWIQEATTPKVLRDGSPLDYGYMWWPASRAAIHDGAFSAIGIFGQAIYINPRERIVIVQWCAQTKPTDGEVVKNDDFFGAVATALR